MSDQVFISISADRTEFFRWSNDRLAQALTEKPGEGSKVGGVYLGRVTGIDASLNAAFVEIGLARPGLLPLKKQGNQPTEGDAVIVQIRRDGREEKGVRLTTSIKTMVDVSAKGKQAPALLLSPPNLWQRALEALEAVESITCDRRVDVPIIEAWCAKYRPSLADKVIFQAERDWIPSRADIKDAIAECLEEEVLLPGGGKLLVEPVRTLTAIDVNSAGANAEKGMERTALSVNIEAAREIPRQLALRNIGGTIVIDFIDLENRNKREQVLNALREAAGIDPAIEWVGNMSRLGLVELSRRRSGPTLAEMWHG
ncbi:ribonuclease E/G [Dongia rigui]|uniref:Ribonuclease E/G n=1 Tax=Dongia rigui TaxID=940149 RepID=A0ABU5E2C6_9PROT|nr:ribonuclease E/G [Dongia rigui]MDY0873350.1 ribonuclease E/G [Dongia rigui]